MKIINTENLNLKTNFSIKSSYPKSFKEAVIKTIKENAGNENPLFYSFTEITEARLNHTEPKKPSQQYAQNFKDFVKAAGFKPNGIIHKYVDNTEGNGILIDVKNLVKI
ncbi:hypothetical protein M0R04_08720 [Candidatus Dojkabacteria bacterium]|jgi:hypothetical protein|nr:hypothetical protein [Candidatus Dojkabacteria bacterium]